MQIDQDLLTQIIEIADQAGELILDYYQQELEPNIKADNTPVTAADIAASDLIIAKLKQLTPELPVLSEEAADFSWQERQSWHSYWLIDPLDGTKEFIKKTGEFTVNIALITEHHPILGVVTVPAKQLAYAGLNTKQQSLAKKRQANGHWQTIQVTKAQLPFTVVTSRRANSKELQDYIARLAESERQYAGSALKMCQIAEGSADLYPKFGPTSEWDTAAAQCILSAAGGYLTDLKGKSLEYNRKASLLNPKFMAWGDKALAPLEFLS